MKISIYALHLGFGGVEKYVATLANILCEKNDVEIVSTYKIIEEPAFYINPNVKIEYLITEQKPNKAEILNSIKNFKLTNFLKQSFYAIKILYKKYIKNIASIKKSEADIIISTRIFHNRLISKYARNAIIKITGEHNHHNNDSKYIKKVLKSCKGFDFFIPISKYLCDFYEPKMKLIGVKTKYIKFCVDDNEMKKSSNLLGYSIISVGRLSPEKAFTDLIDVFSKINKKNKRTKLNIIGDGIEREKLDKLVKKYNLQRSVVFHGLKDKNYVFSEMIKNDIYLMTSYSESFGIVLLEAMNFGLPCIAFSSAQGAKEIIQNGENGRIIYNRDKDKMADIVCSLFNNRDNLKSLSQGAIETAKQYSYDSTKYEWQNFIESLSIEGKKFL